MEKHQLGPHNRRPELKLGPSCTARRDESDGNNEDVQKMVEELQEMSKCHLGNSPKYANHLLRTMYIYIYVCMYYTL